MENARGSKLKKNNVNGSPSQVATRLAKNSMKFSKRLKSFKSPQSGTIETWLKKDTSSCNGDMQSYQSCSKLKNVENISMTYNNHDPNNKSGVNSNENNEQSSSSNTRVINKEKYAVKKVFKEEISNFSSKSEIKKKSHALQEVDITDVETLCKENMARKKFKTIIALPCLSSVDEKLNDISQTNTKSKDSNSSTKCNVTPNKQNESSEDLRALPKNLKSPVFTAGTSVRRLISPSDETNTLLKKNTEENKLDSVEVKRKEDNLKLNKKKESTKCNPKKSIEGSKKTNRSTSKSKRRVKQDDAAISSTKQKKYSVDLRSSEHSPDTSVSQNNNLSTWLTKDTTSKSRHTKQSGKSSIQSGSHELKTAHKISKKYNKLDIKINSKIPKKQHTESSEKKSISKKKKAMQTLDDYVKESMKDSNKRKFSKTELNESSDFPSFVKTTKKIKTHRTSESFKKYGIAVPSVEEILKEKEDLVQYKNQVESFKDIDDTFFELPFSVTDMKSEQVIKANILDCKHLSDSDIEQGFKKNFDYISDIFHGKAFSERHERFFEANVKSYAFTVKDLCYNTSTIVFSFEQKEILLSMLKKEFDPDDKKTLYFFQVLLPELCLKIFMDTHNMTYDEAVKYLDTRPVVD